MRRLRDRFDTRRLADWLDEALGREVFTAEDREFIDSRTLFFLATADANGLPDCSVKGGGAGFVRATGASELAFPSDDGNGMFCSLGNVVVNPAVVLLFIDFERPQRLRVDGRAHIRSDAPLLQSFAGAQLVVRAARISPNGPLCVHRIQLVESSPDMPRAGVTPPIPAWKRFEAFRDVPARDDPARAHDRGAGGATEE